MTDYFSDEALDQARAKAASERDALEHSKRAWEMRAPKQCDSSEAQQELEAVAGAFLTKARALKIRPNRTFTCQHMGEIAWQGEGYLLPNSAFAVLENGSVYLSEDSESFPDPGREGGSWSRVRSSSELLRRQMLDALARPDEWDRPSGALRIVRIYS